RSEPEHDGAGVRRDPREAHVTDDREAAQPAEHDQSDEGRDPGNHDARRQFQRMAKRRIPQHRYWTGLPPSLFHTPPNAASVRAAGRRAARGVLDSRGWAGQPDGNGFDRPRSGNPRLRAQLVERAWSEGARDTRTFRPVEYAVLRDLERIARHARGPRLRPTR